MGEDVQAAVLQEGRQPSELMLVLLERAMDLIRGALREGRRNAAAKLYRGNENDTKATAGALLSAWETFAHHLDCDEEMLESVSMAELAALLIRRAYNRMRRKDYGDRKLADQVARSRVRGKDGDLLPFDPAAPPQTDDVVKILPEEIAAVLRQRSERDRLVIELWLDGDVYEKIVECVRATLPEEAVSTATISRIIDRFRDDLHQRLREE